VESSRDVPSGSLDPVCVVHTSDLHLGSDVQSADPRPTASLEAVLTTAAGLGADLLLVAGDLFDNNRVSDSLVDLVARLMDAAGLRSVILPGNHDALTSDSVYRRATLAQARNVTVLGLDETLSISFPQWDVEVWGRAHRSYSDMPPFAVPPPRSTRWRITIGHGHYEPEGSTPADHTWRPSWRFRDEDLLAASSDYVALGHWERAQQVGDPDLCAYYSGSPGCAGTVNLVRLGGPGGISTERVRLAASDV
jgi:DNA repair exonuclease SbcCD nuclease subunit